MKNLPEKVYLQVDPENEEPEDFDILSEVTWCTDRINITDEEYIHESVLLNLVDIVWQTATKSTKVPSTCWGLEMIQKAVDWRLPTKPNK
jgi:hypothetical protein